MNYIELKSAIILGIVDTIVEDRVHIPETNHKRLPRVVAEMPVSIRGIEQEKHEWLHLDYTFAMNLS